MARTQEQRKADTRDRLLRASAELFAREGFDAVSVDAIADAAERTSGSVYAHFGSKQGLLLALMEAFQDEMAAIVEAEFAAHPDLEGRILGLWHSVADHVEGDAWFLLEIELWLRAVRDPDIGSLLRDRYRSVHGLMGGEFTSWVDEFDLHPIISRDRLGVAVMSVLIGLALQHRLGPDAVPDDLALSTLLSVFGGR